MRMKRRRRGGVGGRSKGNTAHMHNNKYNIHS